MTVNKCQFLHDVNLFNYKIKNIQQKYKIYHTGRFLFAADLQNPVNSFVNHFRPVWPPGM